MMLPTRARRFPFFFAFLLLCSAPLLSVCFNFHSQQPRKFGQVATAATLRHRACRHRSTASRKNNSALFLLLEVPDGFFTVTFPMLGILLSLSKSFSRVRMEERAWEQRLEEGRRERLERDPSLTELDLRRMEAEKEWSAYGLPRMQEEKDRQQRQRNEKEESRDGPKRRVKVRERSKQDVDEDDPRQYRMTDQEIQAFEIQYNVDYDPYYDDPYTEDELPEEKYSLDKRYGDRIYENGEIFYKDEASGLFYRQGAKPRNLSFWN